MSNGYKTQTKVGSYDMFYENLWNSWDEFGLLKGLSRRPNETNLNFGRRVIKTQKCDASKQGLINALSHTFDETPYNVAEKKIFVSSYAPLSFTAYQRMNVAGDYVLPRIFIISSQEEFVFPEDKLPENASIVSFPNGYVTFEKTVIQTKYGTWTLWKNIDQTYLPLWETSHSPALFRIKYTAVIDNKLVVIEESAKPF